MLLSGLKKGHVYLNFGSGEMNSKTCSRMDRVSPQHLSDSSLDLLLLICLKI